MPTCDISAVTAQLKFDKTTAEYPATPSTADAFDSARSLDYALDSPVKFPVKSACKKGALQGTTKPQHKQSTINKFLILPAVLAILGFWVLGEPLTALLLFHAGLIGASLMYMPHSTTKYFANNLLKRPKTQIFIGSIIAILVIIVTYIAYLLAPLAFPGIIERASVPFMHHPTWYLAILGVEFSVVNPIVEQWYWNTFLAANIGENHQNKKRYFIKFQLFFAAYHFFNLLYVFDVQVACVGTVMVFIAGVNLLLIRMFIGFRAAVLAHFGADFAIALCCFDMITRKLSMEH